MLRNLFQRHARRAVFLLRRLATRALRFVHRQNREPVRQWTEADLRALDHAYGALVGSTLGAVVAVLLLVVVWRPL